MPEPFQRPEFVARYFVESSLPSEQAAEIIAGEQSSGTFTSVPGETDELKQRSRARVLRIEPLPAADHAALPSAYVQRRAHSGRYHRANIEIAFPIGNVGASLPSLLATIAGNLFELGEVTGLRLLDLDLPADYAAQFPGPKFGIAGTRKFAGVFDRPLIGTIIKPSIGLTPEQTAQLVDSLCAADIDFIKDDELIADPPYAPFDARLRAVMPVLRKHADRLGRMPMYAINVSGSVDQMLRRHDAILAAGGTAMMFSINWVGFAGAEHLRRHSQLALHGHRNGWGMFTRDANLGFSFTAYQKLWRLTGVDQLHVNGIRSKFWEPDESVLASAAACLTPFSGVAPVMPVFSSGQWAEQADDLWRRLRSNDLMHLAGGGIIGHPDGSAAGVASMREAWAAAQGGISAAEYAKTHPALARALAHFGARG